MALSQRNRVADHKHLSSDIADGYAPANVRRTQSTTSAFRYMWFVCINSSNSTYEAYGGSAIGIRFGGADNVSGKDGTSIGDVLEAVWAIMITEGGGLVHVMAGIYLTARSITIPKTDNTTYTTPGTYDVQIIVEGEGANATIFKATATMDDVIKRTPNQVLDDVTTHAFVTLRDLGVECNTFATEGIDMSEPNCVVAGRNSYDYECPKGIMLERVRVLGAKSGGYAINMNHCDNSYVTDCLTEGPETGGKALLWCIQTGRVKLVRGWWHGDVEVSGQTVTLDCCELDGVRVLLSSGTVHLIDAHCPSGRVLSGGAAFFEVAYGQYCDSLIMESPSVALPNGANFIQGGFTHTIKLHNCQIFPISGTCTIFPNSPTLTSKFIGSGLPAAASLTGIVFGGAGAVYVVPPTGYTAGVDVINCYFIGDAGSAGGLNFGNIKWGEAPPAAGTVSYKDITLPVPLAGASYYVQIQSGSVNGHSCWVSDKTNLGFRLNWQGTTADLLFYVDWKLVYQVDI